MGPSVRIGRALFVARVGGGSTAWLVGVGLRGTEGEVAGPTGAEGHGRKGSHWTGRGPRSC